MFTPSDRNIQTGTDYVTLFMMVGKRGAVREQGHRMSASITGYAFGFISVFSHRPARLPTESASERGPLLRELCIIDDFFVRARQRRVFERSMLKTPPAWKRRIL